MKLFRNYLEATLAVFACILLGSAFAQEPSWWIEKGIGNTPSDNQANFNAANVGQLKYISKRAAEVLDSKLSDSGGAGPEISNMVNSFSGFDPSAPDENYKIANIGQLKYVAKKFYDRLFELGTDKIRYPHGMELISGGADSSSNKYPWPAISANPSAEEISENYKAALVGQLKYLFSWDVLENSGFSYDGIGNGWYNNFAGEYSQELGDICPLIIEPIGSTYITGESVQVKVMVKDARGNAIKNAAVKFYAPDDNSASLSSLSAFSAPDGSASITASLAQNCDYAMVVAYLDGSQDQKCTFTISRASQPVPGYEESVMFTYMGIDSDRFVNDGLMVGEFDSIGSLAYNLEPKTILYGYNVEETYSNNEDFEEYTYSQLKNEMPHIVVGYGTYPTKMVIETGWYLPLDPDYDYQSPTGEVLVGYKESISANYGDFVPSLKPNLRRSGMECDTRVYVGSTTNGFYKEVYFYYSPWISNISVNEYQSATIKVSAPRQLITEYCDEISVSGGFSAVLEGNRIIISPPSSGTGTGVLTLTNNYSKEGAWSDKMSVSYNLEAGPADGGFSVNVTEFSSQKYRKVAFNGRPLADEKPQLDPESDSIKVESYIDAFTQSLRYDVLDAYIPLQNTDLSLSVRRNYKSASWRIVSGLRPSENPAEPFGENWSTNLCSYAKMEIVSAGNKTSPDTITVYDENGMPFVFGIVYSGNSISKAYPMPSNKADVQAFLNTLEISEDESTVTSSAYDGCNNIIASVDANGFWTTYSYDCIGRPVSKKLYKTAGSDSGDYAQTQLFYGQNCGSSIFANDGFKPTKTIDSNGFETTFEYDSLYRLTKTQVEYSKNPSLKRTTTYAYDDVGNKVSETDSNGNTTLFEYDPMRNLTKTTYADGNFKSAAYTSASLVLSETDELGNTVEYAYDAMGHILSKTFPAVDIYGGAAPVNPIERYICDGRGNIVRKISPNGFGYDYVYDGMNRLVYEIAPAMSFEENGSVVYRRPTRSTAYDFFGNAVRKTDPNGNEIEYFYDYMNRPVRVVYKNAVPAGDLQELNSYDANGNLTDFTDKAGRVTHTVYNYLNKPVSVTRNYGESVSITETAEYDGEGNVTARVDGEGNRTEYTYDGLNRLTLASYGVGGDAQRSRPYAYDALNLVQDIGVSYDYDNRNRLICADEIGMTDQVYQVEYIYNYTYDALGRVVHCQDIWNEYDSNGRLTSETSNGFEHRYQYDLNGNRMLAEYGYEFDENSIYPFSIDCTHRQRFLYDANNRVISITDGDARITTYQYDLNGNIVKQTYPNGVEILRQYDTFNRVTSIVAKKDSAVLQTNTYSYDAVGNVVELVQESQSRRLEISNQYDAFDRLSKETRIESSTPNSSLVNTYFYDSANNIVEVVKTYDLISERTEYVYNSLNQIISMRSYDSNNEAIHTYTYTYNGKGCLNIVKKDGKSVAGYSFNGFFHLVSFYTNDNSNITQRYYYDYRGRRISESPFFAEYYREYTYSGGTSVIEYEYSENSGNVSISENILYYRGPDMGGGVGGINYACDLIDNSINYKHYNLRGDVIMTTGPAGSVLSELWYTAYGEYEGFGALPSDKYRANTKVDDGELILDGHRYRNKALMRFMSPDPLEYIDGLNCYIYCSNNPWGRFDPDGLAKNDISGIQAWGWVGYTAFSTNPGTEEQQKEWSQRAGVAADLVTAVAGASLSKAAVKEVAQTTAKTVVKKEAKTTAKISAKTNAKNSLKDVANSSVNVKVKKKQGHYRKIEPCKDTNEPHSVFAMNNKGEVIKYVTFKPQSNPRNPSKFEREKMFHRGDLNDINESHYYNGEKIIGPHIHEGGKVRKARPDEIPGSK